MRHLLPTIIGLLAVAGVSAFAQTSFAQTKQPVPVKRQHSKTSSTQSSSAEKENIREAVFRYLIDCSARKAKHSGGDWTKIIFLSIGDRKSPSSALIARFASSHIPVKPFSSAVVKDRLYKDKATNEQGLLYYIRKINRQDATQSTVDGGWMSSPKGGIFALYTVKKSKGKWAVTSEKALGQY